jgi:transcriptional regulator with XRE-family HTH domain
LSLDKYYKRSYIRGIVNASSLRESRLAAGLTQVQLAKKVGKSQGYVSLLEQGQRSPSASLVKRLARVLRLPPTALPIEVGRRGMDRGGSDKLAKNLAALGYPGFAYLGHSRTLVNPAEVLLRTLAVERVDPRLIEATPWLLLCFSDFDCDRTVVLARTYNIQNRLGFVVALAISVAESNPAYSGRLSELNELSSALEPFRLAREDDFGGQFKTERLRRWVRENRSEAAEHWNLLTDLGPQHLAYSN